MTDFDEAQVSEEDPTALSEGVGGVPEIPEEERATVGDADDDNVDTDEPQMEPNR